MNNVALPVLLAVSAFFIYPKECPVEVAGLSEYVIARAIIAGGEVTPNPRPRPEPRPTPDPSPDPSPEVCPDCNNTGWVTHGDGHRTPCPSPDCPLKNSMAFYWHPSEPDSVYVNGEKMRRAIPVEEFKKRLPNFEPFGYWISRTRFQMCVDKVRGPCYGFITFNDPNDLKSLKLTSEFYKKGVK